MDNITSAINLLGAVISTMDTIDIRGVENQDKFVGCANAIQTVSQTLTKFLSEAQEREAAPADASNQEEENGR